jgi:hypothetical protein
MVVCKYCGSENVRVVERKSKKTGQLIKVTQDFCKDCFYKKRQGVPFYFNKEFLEHEHLVLKKSVSQIAEENSITEDKVRNHFKKYKITEIKRCKHCGTTENLVVRNSNNKFLKEPKPTVQSICENCWSTLAGKGISESRQNESSEKKKQRRENTRKYYEDHPEQKIKETEKRKETWDSKPKKEDIRIITGVCKICNKNCYGDNGLSVHLSIAHESIDHYDYYLKNIGEIEYCLCGKPKKFISIAAGFAKTCCDKTCINENYKQVNLKNIGVEYPTQSEEVQEKRKQTCLEKYNVEHPMQLESFIEERRQNSLEKYGVTSPSMLLEVKEKGKQTKLNNIDENGLNGFERQFTRMQETMLERYGVRFAMQCKDILETRERNNLEKYGTIDPSHLPEANEKRRLTCLERYKTEFSSQDITIRKKGSESLIQVYKERGEEIQEKKEKTCMKKYNENHPRKNKEINDKIIKTMNEKYGGDCPCASEEVVNKMIITKENNQKIHGNKPGEGVKAKKLFDTLIELITLLNTEYDFLLKEKIMYVGDVSETNFARYLDFYIKIGDREINIEFDENWHCKTIQNDFLREQEILKKKPNIEIYRIKEKQWDENPTKVILDILDILQGGENKEYLSLIEQSKNSQ